MSTFPASLSRSSRKRKHADPGCPCTSCLFNNPDAARPNRSSTTASGASTIAAATETGSHELTISGYSRTKGLGVGEAILSTEFAVAGHYWRIMYFPDGYNEEGADWITLALHLDDDAADVAVRADFQFSVLDQNGHPVEQFTFGSSSETFDNQGNAVGVQLIEREQLESSPHLKDDCFRLSCQVSVIKLRSSLHFQGEAPATTDLHRHLGDLLGTEIGADVKFRVGRQTFMAHKSVLATRSSVFKAEFFGAMKETNTTSCICIKVKDMQARVFKAMLHFIYTDSLPEMEEEDRRAMAQHLFVAADRYDLKRLKLICEDMLCLFIDVNTAANTLALADQHGCHRLK